MAARSYDGLEALSEREKQTLRLLLAGHDAKSIARELGLSVHTINERLRDARRKLGVSSSREAARLLGEAEQATPNFLGDSDLGVSGRSQLGRKERRGAGSSAAWLAGGILVMLIVFAAAMLAPTLWGSASSDAPAQRQPAAASADATQSAAAEAARAWAGLVDGARWEESWRAAAAMFRSQVTVDQWTASAQPVRQPLGAVSSRAVESVTRTRSLPGAPAGEYEVVQFRTEFAQRTATETVVMVREGSAWKVSGYFIR